MVSFFSVTLLSADESIETSDFFCEQQQIKNNPKNAKTIFFISDSLSKVNERIA
jgi:hypothetical protein